MEKKIKIHLAPNLIPDGKDVSLVELIDTRWSHLGRGASREKKVLSSKCLLVSV